MLIRRFLKTFFLATAWFIILSCSQNVFSELGSKSTDEALLFDAKTAVNNQDYQTAITIITTSLSSQSRTTVAAKEILASAYAGKCGLNFVNYVNALSTASTTTAFKLVAFPFIGTVVDPASCLDALNTMESIGPSASRTSTENAFTAIVGMSLMGAAVRLYTDNSPTNGDGSQDSNNISCNLTNSQIDYVVLGFGFMTTNFSYVSAAQLGSSSMASLNAVISTCTSIAGSSCTITDPAQITTPIRDTIKDLLNTSDYGVGTVATSNNPILIAGACP